MSDNPVPGQAMQLFADLLDYPYASVVGTAGQCAELVADRSPEAASLLQQFESFAKHTSLSRLQEIYTGVFELDATCHPYVGYHLFGESYKRSAFLLGLQERYRAYQLQHGVELPDHLAVVLRYLAVNQDRAETEEMISEALHPTLRKLLKEKEEEPPDPSAPKPPTKGAEYRRVLQALHSVLQTVVADDPSAPLPMPVDEFTPSACN